MTAYLIMLVSFLVFLACPTVSAFGSDLITSRSTAPRSFAVTALATATGISDKSSQKKSLVSMNIDVEVDSMIGGKSSMLYRIKRVFN